MKNKKLIKRVRKLKQRIESDEHFITYLAHMYGLKQAFKIKKRKK